MISLLNEINFQLWSSCSLEIKWNFLNLIFDFFRFLGSWWPCFNWIQFLNQRSWSILRRSLQGESILFLRSDFDPIWEIWTSFRSCNPWIIFFFVYIKEFLSTDSCLVPVVTLLIVFYYLSKTLPYVAVFVFYNVVGCCLSIHRLDELCLRYSLDGFIYLILFVFKIVNVSRIFLIFSIILPWLF